MLAYLIIFFIIISPMIFRKKAAFITIQVMIGLIILLFTNNFGDSFLIRVGMLWVISSLISIRITVGDERNDREVNRNVRREESGNHTDLFLDKK